MAATSSEEINNLQSEDSPQSPLTVEISDSKPPASSPAKPSGEELPAAAKRSDTSTAQGPDLITILIFLFWACASITMSLFNKYLYGGPFPFPLTLTSLHMAFAAVVTALLRATGHATTPSFSWDVYLKAVVPIGALYALSLAFSNLAAQRLSVSFVQMCKAFTPMVALAAGIHMGVEKPTLQAGAIAAIFSASVAISAVGELRFELVGFIFQMLAVASEASRLIAMQYLLQVHLSEKPSPLVSLSLFTPVSFCFLIPLSVWFERDALQDLFLNSSVAYLIVLNVSVALLLNVGVVLLIGRSSGLAFVFAGIIKDVMLVSLSVLLFGSPVTYIQVFGYFCCLFGLNMNTIYREAKGDISLIDLVKAAASNYHTVIASVSMVLLGSISQPGASRL